MRVLICWAVISGYMAACWRAMAARPGIELLVLAKGGGDPKEHADFDDALMRGVPCRLLAPGDPIDAGEVLRHAAEFRPDVVVINGWNHPAYTELPFRPALASVPFLMAMDTPRLGTVRQHLGRFVKRRLFRRLSGVIVAGERSWQLARLLGFGERRIKRGVYGVDFDSLSPTYDNRVRRPGGWPRRFLYTGRYVHEKAIDVLLEGYGRYRAQARDPWPLTCCGRGPFARQIAAAPGAEDKGFLQPHDLLPVLEGAGAFVLASRFDPWPLVIVEACAAGLPVVCTEACGSRVEMVRDGFNGMGFAGEDPEALARALSWVHGRHSDLPAMGLASRTLASAYSAQMWGDRWAGYCAEAAGP